MKLANKGECRAESVEGRGGAKGNRVGYIPPPDAGPERCRVPATRPCTASSKATEGRSGSHHCSTTSTPTCSGGECSYALHRRAAAGVDGVTWQDYEHHLEVRLIGRMRDLHRSAYRQHGVPSRRQYIAKPDGTQRPLGIAALEDKIVQRAVVRVLNAVYEADFLGFSYGFRRGVASTMRWMRWRLGSRARM